MTTKSDIIDAIQAIADASGNLDLRASIGDPGGGPIQIRGEVVALGRAYADPGFLDSVIEGIAATMDAGQGPVVVTGATNESTSTLTTEAIIGGLAFNGGLIPAGKAAKFRYIGKYTAIGAAGEAKLRLYDRGPTPGPPVAAVLRSETVILFADAGDIRVRDQTLTPSASPSGLGQIYNAPRVYEVRLFLDSVQVGDSMDVYHGGIAIE